MSFQEAIKIQEPETFSFPAIYDGIAVKVTVAKENARFLVLIDNVSTAKIILNEDNNTWHVTTGYLDDNDLVQEIGGRIKGKYKNFSS